MESILLSMKPQRCEKVVSGEITIDIRKTRVNIVTPFKVYLYCTKPKRANSDKVKVGHVVGEFICKSISYYPFREMFAPPLWEEILGNAYYITCGELDKTGMSYEELCSYGNEKDVYGLEISDLEIYDVPKPLNDFYYAGAPDSCELEDELCAYCSATDYGETKCYSTPNGYYMCEGSWCGEAYDCYLEENYTIVHPPRSFCRVEVI